MRIPFFRFIKVSHKYFLIQRKGGTGGREKRKGPFVMMVEGLVIRSVRDVCVRTNPYMSYRKILNCIESLGRFNHE